MTFATLSPATPDKVLPDIQATPDTRNVALKAAGIRQVRLPLTVLEKTGGLQTVQATLSACVNVSPQDKGAHLSRLMIALADWAETPYPQPASPNKTQPACMSFQFAPVLETLCAQLSADATTLEAEFPYFIPKAAPVSGLTAPMAYDVKFKATRQPRQVPTLTLTVTVPVSTLCPCSKAISDAGAHNQRAMVEITVVQPLPTQDTAPIQVVWIEDVVALADKASSCPVFPILKRVDEKWVTERQYHNAKFVEDVVRDAVVTLRDWHHIDGFSVSVEALESIHAHNAWAEHAEGCLA